MAAKRKKKSDMPAPRPIKLIASDRKLEAPFSNSIRKQLNHLGLYSYKISDRYRSGIPDIYVAGGLWIESKIIPRMPSRLTGPMKYFSGPQKVELNELTRQGDQCFGALYFAFDANNAAFALVPWWELFRIALWDLDTIQSLGVILNSRFDSDFKLDRFFDPKHPNKFDPDIWWNDAFDKWVRRNPEKFDPEKVEGKAARVLAGRRAVQDGVQPGYEVDFD